MKFWFSCIYYAKNFFLLYEYTKYELKMFFLGICNGLKYFISDEVTMLSGWENMIDASQNAFCHPI